MVALASPRHAVALKGGQLSTRLVPGAGVASNSSPPEDGFTVANPGQPPGNRWMQTLAAEGAIRCSVESRFQRSFVTQHEILERIL